MAVELESKTEHLIKELNSASTISDVIMDPEKERIKEQIEEFENSTRSSEDLPQELMLINDLEKQLIQQKIKSLEPKSLVQVKFLVKAGDEIYQR